MALAKRDFPSICLLGHITQHLAAQCAGLRVPTGVYRLQSFALYSPGNPLVKKMALMTPWRFSAANRVPVCKPFTSLSLTGALSGSVEST